MFKKSLLALAVLGSSSAFATTTINDTTELNFATELFGTSDLVLSGAGRDVAVAVTDLVSDGATASFTFTLSSGTFGANPTLSFATTGGTGDAGVSLTSGGVGESSATFTVVVTEVFDGDEVFTLNVPSLSGASALATAGGTVSVDLTVDNTNIVAQGFDETVVVGDDGATPAIDDNVIALSSDAITFDVTGLTMTGVDVDDQTQFAGAVLGQDMFENVDFAETGALSEDGVNPLALTADDTVTITIGGNFAADSKVCLAADGATDCDADPGNTFPAVISGGTATITLDGNDAVALANTSDIVYEVDGVATVMTSDFSISASVAFDTATYDSPTELASDEQSTLSLAGLNEQANRINIITKPGAADETFIRVTNTTDAESVVYITLTTQDGQSVVTGQLDSIAGNATEVYTSEEIATAVGVETWSGRGNAVILTSAPAADVVVVPLVRTSGVLTNQSGALVNP